jgi:hypothetical protein
LACGDRTYDLQVMRQKVHTITVQPTRDGYDRSSIFKEYGFVVRQRLRKSASDLHSEAADCRTSQGIKLPEEQISHTP